MQRTPPTEGGAMTAHRLRRIASGSLAAVLAGLALASPPAFAGGPTPSLTERQYLASHGTGAPRITERERQYLASHGVGAPGLPAETRSTVPAARPADSGFDWTAAAIGAGAAAAAILLVALVTPALTRRRRVRTAS
jgi:hypothetical protein